MARKNEIFFYDNTINFPKEKFQLFLPSNVAAMKPLLLFRLHTMFYSLMKNNMKMYKEISLSNIDVTEIQTIACKHLAAGSPEQIHIDNYEVKTIALTFPSTK